MLEGGWTLEPENLEIPTLLLIGRLYTLARWGLQFCCLCKDWVGTVPCCGQINKLVQIGVLPVGNGLSIIASGQTDPTLPHPQLLGGV